MLSDDQFGEMASALQEPDGGYSTSVRTGRSARPGYMVSINGRGERFPAGRTVSGSDIRAHAEANMDKLGQPAHYAGGWHNPETHDLDLDVSRRFTSHDRAIHAMWKNDEDALYNSHEWRSERNMLGRGPAIAEPGGVQLRGRLPLGVSPMSPDVLRQLGRGRPPTRKTGSARYPTA